MDNLNPSHDAVKDGELTDVRLTTERKAQLNKLVQCDQDKTVDELMYMAGAYESLAMRVATQRRSS